MTTNAERAATLERALRAGVDGDADTLLAVLTDDVRAWTPLLSTTDLAELLDELGRRDDAFSGHTLEMVALDVGGDFACVEWTVEMAHTGALAVDDAVVVDPSDTRVTVHGVTVAEFDGDRICSLRQYWDELAPLEQVGAVRRER